MKTINKEIKFQHAKIKLKIRNITSAQLQLAHAQRGSEKTKWRRSTHFWGKWTHLTKVHAFPVEINAFWLLESNKHTSRHPMSIRTSRDSISFASNPTWIDLETKLQFFFSSPKHTEFSAIWLKFAHTMSKLAHPSGWRATRVGRFAPHGVVI